ncbi:probable chitinase 10 isoform X2 [Episyrphus balteatus]|uniref:probable chitinase 10 isoform X2 n=1 Tax=Episyrphus balteatus TaxID=286459 RepID=UPI0024856E55|nr:probable chitinase 10 isoform X2 [Episyrphus balteatus]
MKVYIWKLITLCTSLSIAFAIERSVWMPSCSTYIENTLIPHPGDCRKFFVCIHGTAIPVSCPYGLNWNPTLNECSTISACENDERRNRVPKYNPLCPLDENPANPTHLPDKYDCRKFYECESGFAFQMICPNGEHWSVEHDSCKEPSLANCKYSQKAIGTSQLNHACPLIDNPNNPTLLPHPEDCTKFYKCSFGRSYIVSCPFGLHFNTDISRCDSPFKAQCVQKKLTTLSTTETPPTPTIKTSSTPQTNFNTEPTINTSQTQPSSTTKRIPNLPICPENGVKNFGIPGQCNKYFACSQGKLYMMTCRAGREWSEIASGCVKSSVAGCSVVITNGLSLNISTRKPVKPVLSSNTQKPLEATTRSTKCSQGVGFLSHPTDCHKFFVCDNGRPVEMSCPSGLYFSRSTSSCQWIDSDC